jgi:hypothetical protein
MAKEKHIPHDKLEGYEPPSGRSLTLRVEGGEQKYIEVDTASLDLPPPETDEQRAARETAMFEAQFSAHDEVFDALVEVGSVKKVDADKAKQILRDKRRVRDEANRVQPTPQPVPSKKASSKRASKKARK